MKASKFKKQSQTKIARLAGLAFLTLVPTFVRADITVTSERRIDSLPTDGTFVFTEVPSNSSTDLANGKPFVVLDGIPSSASAPISALTDGPAQTNSDSVAESFFANGTSNIRVQLDLGSVNALEQINSYSWHQNARAPQIYRVYGATSPANNAPDFTAAAFQDDEALTGIGYTLIAEVNNQALGQNGQYGASIAGTIGDYRYLLFDMAPPVWGVGPRPTFYGEIDVIGGPPPVPEPFRLTITPVAAGYDLAWDSKFGKRYNLRTSTDLASPISDWELAGETILPTPPTNVLHVDPAGARRFYAVEAVPAPPLLAADFENGDGGFSVTTAGGTAWEYGMPDSPFPPQAAVTGANSGANCWGTNLTGAYAAGTDTSLLSPVIDLTDTPAASLSFAQAVDLNNFSEPPHTLEVNVLNATTNALIVNLVAPATDGKPMTAAWEIVGPLALPVGQPVRIEWRVIADGTGEYNGVYIDDVMVEEANPAPEMSE